MAHIELEPDRLHVRLGPLEKLGALHGDLCIPLAAISSVRVDADPFASVRGLRAPGVGVPRVALLGTWRRRRGSSFVAAYRGQPAIVLDVDDERHERVIVSTADAASMRRTITKALAAHR